MERKILKKPTYPAVVEVYFILPVKQTYHSGMAETKQKKRELKKPGEQH
jgi:hypothetical protein